jgi:hypothetical protein
MLLLFYISLLYLSCLKISSSLYSIYTLLSPPLGCLLIVFPLHFHRYNLEVSYWLCWNVFAWSPVFLLEPFFVHILFFVLQIIYVDIDRSLISFGVNALQALSVSSYEYCSIGRNWMIELSTICRSKLLAMFACSVTLYPVLRETYNELSSHSE